MKLKRQSTLVAVAALVGSLVTACGNDNQSAQMSNTPPPPPPSMPSGTQVNTTEFLTSYTNQSSDTDAPLEINGGIFTFTDVSDTATSVALDGAMPN
jgi:hypothetical protein